MLSNVVDKYHVALEIQRLKKCVPVDHLMVTSN